MHKLTKLGFGQIVTKEDMKRDNILPVNQYSNVFLKPHISTVNTHISTVNKDVFQMCSEELMKESYVDFFNKEVDEVTVKIIQKYHKDRNVMGHSQVTHNTGGSTKWNFFHYK